MYMLNVSAYRAGTQIETKTENLLKIIIISY